MAAGDSSHPGTRRLRLMAMPSFIRCPSAIVRLARSEPARSTKWNLAAVCSSVSSPPASDGACGPGEPTPTSLHMST